MNAKLKLATVEEPQEPTPRELLIAAHERVKTAELTLGRVRDRKRLADNARWNAKQAAASARKAVAAAQVVDPAAILEAMQRGVDPTQPTAGLERARDALGLAEAAQAEAERNLGMWDGVVAEAEKSLAKAKMAYDTAAVAVWQPVRDAIDQRIRHELEQHLRLQAAYSAFAWNLRHDPHAQAPI
jgi:hypothetical protein